MSPLLKALTYISAFLIGCSLAQQVTQKHYIAKIAVINQQHAEKQEQAAKASEDRLRAAQSLADVLSATLASRESSIKTTTLEKTRAIPHYVTGNTCFSADLTRLLNNQVGEPFPITETTSAPATEDAAVATDTDVAGWIVFAQGEYETCRARLGALIDFELRKE